MEKKQSLTSRLSKLAFGAGLGFTLFLITSHPKSKVNKKLPSKKIKNFHLLPYMKYVSEKNEYHFHHWMNISLLYALTSLLDKKAARSHYVRGFFLGSILQGLLYKDRFHFKYPSQPPHQEEKDEILLK